MSDKQTSQAFSERDPYFSDTSETRKRKHSDDTTKLRRKKAKQAKRVASAAEAALVQDDGNIDEQKQINRAVGRMDGTLFADLIARAVKRFEPELSLVEMEDLRISQSIFIDTATWPGERIQGNMPVFLEYCTGQARSEFAKASESKGSPHTIVLCGAAIRAADVTRAMRCYQSKEISVAKLFAKHIKLKDAVKFTRSTRISVGVGNAQRVSDLINEGALKLQNLRHIIIDGSWSGPKKRTLLEQQDSAMPLIRLLARQELKQKFERGETSILIF